MSSGLPTNAYVTLSQAVSWIAFGAAQDSKALLSSIISKLHGACYEAAKTRLLSAVNALADAAHGGKVELQGKYLKDNRAQTTATRNESIDPPRFRDFCQFDIKRDALRYGRGLAWLPDAAGEWVYQKNEREDFYAEVLVKRSDLVRAFKPGTDPLPELPNKVLRQWWSSLDPQIRVSSFLDIQRRCREDHPNHSVTRERIRGLDPGRKRGRKAIEPKKHGVIAADLDRSIS
jgi:hypothetical protein